MGAVFWALALAPLVRAQSFALDSWSASSISDNANLATLQTKAKELFADAFNDYLSTKTLLMNKAQEEYTHWGGQLQSIVADARFLLEGLHVTDS